MEKSKLIISSEVYISLYSIPKSQRATLWVWLKHYHLDLQIMTSSCKADELGLVYGCKYSDYCEWYTSWNGAIFFPAMYLESHDSSLTITDCDDILTGEDGALLPDYDEDVMLLRDDLVSFMVFPFRHDSVTINKGGKAYTYYEVEKDLDILFLKAMRNPFMLRLYHRKLEILKTIVTMLFLPGYNYKNTFYI